MTVAVTGAAGYLGGLVAQTLLETLGPDEVILITRRPEAVDQSLRATGAQIRAADFDDPSSLAGAFTGADRALITTTTHESTGRRVDQHRAAIEAAREAGVQHIVLPTMPKVDADHPTGAYALEYAASEEVLKSSGAEWTVLQNGPYAENLLGRAAIAVATGELSSNAGEGRTAPVSHADCAAVAAGVLTGDGHAGKIYVVTGSELFDQAELAALFSEVSDRPVKLVEFSDEDHPARLRRDGIPEPFPRLLTAHLKAVRLGYFDDLTDVVQEVTGRPAERLRDVLTAHRDEILAPGSGS
jgi:NAD(P)H dehydrogenase (quinone)